MKSQHSKSDLGFYIKLFIINFLFSGINLLNYIFHNLQNNRGLSVCLKIWIMWSDLNDADFFIFIFFQISQDKDSILKPEQACKCE